MPAGLLAHGSSVAPQPSRSSDAERQWQCWRGLAVNSCGRSHGIGVATSPCSLLVAPRLHTGLHRHASNAPQLCRPVNAIPGCPAAVSGARYKTATSERKSARPGATISIRKYLPAGEDADATGSDRTCIASAPCRGASAAAVCHAGSAGRSHGRSSLRPRASASEAASRPTGPWPSGLGRRERRP